MEQNHEASRGRQLSSKISKVLIELHNYSFFHSPTSTHQVDPRFLGRDVLRKKLKALLENTETKSGSYLITGYKGMGKSSFVNKVLNEIGIQDSQARFSTPTARLFIGLLLLAILDLPVLFNNHWSYVISLVVSLILVGLLIHLTNTSRYRRDIEQGEYPKWSNNWRKSYRKNFFLTFKKGFLFIEGDRPAARIRIVFKILYQVLLIHFATFSLCFLFHIAVFMFNWSLVWPESIVDKFEIYLILLACLIIYNSWYRYKRSITFQDQSPIRAPEDAKEQTGYGSYLNDKLRQYINSWRRICIRINLGYDDLREIDVLRLVARSIYLKYRTLRWDYLPVGLLRFLVFFSLANLFFYFSPIYDANQSIKERTGLIRYFPSQGFHKLPAGTEQSLAFPDLETYLDTLYDAADSTAKSLFLPIRIPLENEKWWRKIPIHLRKVSIHVDWFVFATYLSLQNNIPLLRYPIRWQENLTPLFRTSVRPGLSPDFRLVHTRPDYLFLIYFVGLWFVLRALARRRLFGIITHSFIRRQLLYLNEVLNSQVTQERFSSLGDDAGSGASVSISPWVLPSWGFSMGRRRTRRIPMADEREIEKYLLEILDLIDRIPPILLRPEFLFVFDELDKVEPHQNYNIAEKQQEALSGGDGEAFFSVDATRGRQQRILKILSNLKHFLNTAKAKFIFIAGREMYDASLADVSDRNYFIGSIFHDVLYVESFLKDDSDDKRADLTSLTETYVCQFILPREEQKKGCSLRIFNEYLKAEQKKELEKEWKDYFSLQDLKEGENLVRITHDYLDRLEDILSEDAGPSLNALSTLRQGYEAHLTAKDIVLKNQEAGKDDINALKKELQTFLQKSLDLPPWYPYLREEINDRLKALSSTKKPSEPVNHQINKLFVSINRLLWLLRAKRLLRLFGAIRDQEPFNPPEKWRDQVNDLLDYIARLLRLFEAIRDQEPFSSTLSELLQKLTARRAYLEKRLKDTDSGYTSSPASFRKLLALIDHALVQIDKDVNTRAKIHATVYEGNLINDLRAHLLKLEQLIEEARRLRQQREKIISILKRFVIYLTYRSNGAPKKLTQFFEDFVVKKNLNALVDNGEHKLVVGRSSNSLYLEFAESDQYMLGLINYLIAPFMLVINRAIKEYGDKLLVSMSFVLDHLFKYHGAGFSWRNLELMPEIIDINKAPQLRELIRIIIQYLSNTHIDLIVSGLYDFRFSKKIVEEIAFVSKISELQSAAFNFTLDESLTSKRHYSKQIRLYEEKYQHISRKRDARYVHSLGFFYMTLGDLHYADEEYDDAIIAYDEALQFLRWIENSDLDKKVNYAQFLTYIRNMLKLGLVYERKKTYDAAFAAYGTIALLTTQYAELMNTVEMPAKKSKKHKQSEPVIQREQKDFFRRSMLEGVRLMYQALIARLEVNEKANLGGITITDIRRIKKQFDLLVRNLKPEYERYLIASEFYDKVGDILFYKNGLITDIVPETEEEARFLEDTHKKYLEKIRPTEETSEPPLPIYCWRKTRLCSRNEHVQDILKNGLKTPCSACTFYMESLKELYTGFLDVNDAPATNQDDPPHFIRKVLEGVSRLYHADKQSDKTYTAMVAMANTLSDVGDTFVSCASRKETIGCDFWKTWFKITGSKDSHYKHEQLKELLEDRSMLLSKIEEALLCYYASALYFVRAGESQQYGYQLIKILYVIRDYIAAHGRPAFEEQLKDGSSDMDSEPSGMAPEAFIKKLRENLVIKALRGMYRAFSNAHRLEIASYRHIFISEEEPEYDAKYVDLNSVSQVVDIRELMIAFYELELKLGRQENIPISKKSISTYAGISSIYNRIIELRYKSNLCHKILEEYYLDLVRKIWEYYEKDEHRKAIKAIGPPQTKDTVEQRFTLLKNLVEACYDLETIFKRKRVKHGRRGLQKDAPVSEEQTKEPQKDDPVSEEQTKEQAYIERAIAHFKKQNKSGNEELAKFLIQIRLQIYDTMVNWVIAVLKRDLDDLEKLKNDLDKHVMDLKDLTKELHVLKKEAEETLSTCEKIIHRNDEKANDILPKRKQIIHRNQDYATAQRKEKIDAVWRSILKKRLEQWQTLINEHVEDFRVEVEKWTEDKKITEPYNRRDWHDATSMLSKCISMERYMDIFSKDENTMDSLYRNAHGLIDEYIKDSKSQGCTLKKSLKLYCTAAIASIIEYTREKAKEEVLQGKNPGPDRAFLLAFWRYDSATKKEQIDVAAMMEYLITDAIYCLHKLIDYFQTYGVSYMNTHSLLASTYAKLATWAARYQTYQQYHRDLDRNYTPSKFSNHPANRIEGILSALIAEDERQTLRYGYNSEMALHHYRYAKELHNEGKAYRSLLDDMFYLNDDYNDNHYHFSASIERYWLNTDIIDERINKLKKITKKSSLYDLHNYDR